MTEPILLLWPFLVSMAVVVSARRTTARRRAALNRAVHELRRPLQAMALAAGSPGRRHSGSSPGSLALALAALDDLDAAINGMPPALTRRPVAARPLLEGAVARW